MEPIRPHQQRTALPLRPRRVSAAAVLAVLLAAGSVVGPEPAAARPKTDTVIMANGDRVLCEIKEMSRGKLKVKTEFMGTVDIEWDEIVELKSPFYFRVETKSGRRLYGSLTLDPASGLFSVATTGKTITFPPQRIVEITPIQSSFWSRNEGSLSLTYDFTKASEVSQFSFDWKNVFKSELNLIDTRVNTLLTYNVKEETSSKRWDISLSYIRLLRSKWAGNVSTAISRNDQLGLNRRILIGLGGGYSLVKSNRNMLILQIGVALNSELATNSTQSTESGEGVLAVNYSLFQYDSPKTDINTQASFYPSFTHEGRYRLDFTLSLRRELFKDFFFEIKYFTNYDSEAPTGKGEKADYGVNTGISWSY